MKQPKPKKCKNPSCGKVFTPNFKLQRVCSVACAYQLARIESDKKYDKEAKVQKAEMKERIKTSSDYKGDLQKIINEIVRIIDGNECISCGQIKERLDAGHFFPRSTDGNIRFHLWNIHGQCRYCNSYRHGAITDYNAGILKRYGQEILNTMHDLPNAYKYKIDKIMVIDAIVKAKGCLDKLKYINYPTISNSKKIELRNKFNAEINLY